MNAPPRTRARNSRLAVRATVLVLSSLLLPTPREALAQQIVRRIGRVTIQVDTAHAFPGGVLVARLGSRGRIGATWALLDGRRAPFYLKDGSARALVPIAAGSEQGRATLGIGIAARRGEQRIAIPVEIGARTYGSRTVSLPEAARALLTRTEVPHDARRLLGGIRTESAERAPGPLRAPVATPGGGYGELRAFAGLSEVESRSDGLAGERHRGLDYAVPVGTPVRAPGAGVVLFAGPLVLSGGTVVIDHGQGVVSVLQGLSRIGVRAHDTVSAGAPLGLSGDSALSAAPLLEWRTYLHEVAVDPAVLSAVLD